MQDATHSESESTETSSTEGSPFTEVVEFVELSIRGQMKERPYVTMAAALGLGYVLGGGLPKFAVKALGAVGMRYAAKRFIKDMFPGG